MKQLAVFCFVALLAIMILPTAQAQEIIGVSPGCFDYINQECVPKNISAGTSEIFEIHIFNLAENAGNYTMRTERDLASHIIFEPANFTIAVKYNPKEMHSGCVASEGCQIVYATLNTKGVKPGQYEALLIASTVVGGDGMLSLNAEVGTRLMVLVQETAFSKFITALKENIILTLLLIIGLIAIMFTLFHKKILNTLEKSKANKIYKKSKEK